MATAPTTPSRSVADSGIVGDSLLRLCKPRVAHSIDAYSTCLGDGIASLSSAGNIKLAMGTLDYVIHDDRSLILLGHPLAHALGYAVRSTPATATRLLTQCDDRYQSGCYHGILQRYFDARIGMPIPQKVLLAPCDGLRGTREQFRLFDCLHGTGHGLMMYHRYDANASLKDCDRLTEEWDQRSCWGGVFMEHNMGARMQTFGDGNFGMHRHSTPASSVVLYKPKNLHYPCDATPVRYRRECYELQADLDPSRSQAGLSEGCQGLRWSRHGRPDSRVLSRARQKRVGSRCVPVHGIRKRCDLASPAGMPFCYQGAVRHLAYAPSELPRGIAFCKSLPDGEGRSRCWGGVGMQIGGFFTDLPSRQRACRSESSADVAACAEGAGL